MTVGQLLSIFDAAIENKLPDEVKIEWIREIDGRVLTDIHGLNPDQVKLPKGEDDVLALPDSYTKAYMFYMKAMIDFFDNKYTGYSNRYREYEATLSMYARHFIRNRT